MKKCPYCAEEIQDEAIVCRYCGRSLRSWTFGRVVMLLVTIFLCLSGWGAIGGAIGYLANPTDRLKGTFSGAWIACLVAVCVIAGLLIIGPLIGNVFVPINSGLIQAIPSTSGAIIYPTKVDYPTNICYMWPKVSSDMKWENQQKMFCVWGVVTKITSAYVYFSESPGAFYIQTYNPPIIHSANGNNKPLAVGDCVRATELIQLDSNGVPYMVARALYKCEP